MRRKNKEVDVRLAFSRWILNMSSILWKEVTFIWEEVMVEDQWNIGFIDLLYKDNDGWLYVIELKINALEKENVFQCAWYVDVLEHNTTLDFSEPVNGIQGVLIWESCPEKVFNLCNKYNLLVYTY